MQTFVKTNLSKTHCPPNMLGAPRTTAERQHWRHGNHGATTPVLERLHLPESQHWNSCALWPGVVRYAEDSQRHFHISRYGFLDLNIRLRVRYPLAKGARVSKTALWKEVSCDTCETPHKFGTVGIRLLDGSVSMLQCWSLLIQWRCGWCMSVHSAVAPLQRASCAPWRAE